MVTLLDCKGTPAESQSHHTVAASPSRARQPASGVHTASLAATTALRHPVRHLVPQPLVAWLIGEDMIAL